MTDKPRAAILLVDDDELLLRSIARVLRPLRRPILSAADAVTAGALLTENEVGVIVCEPRDLRLAAFLVEAREHLPRVVRVILTGYPDLTNVIKAVNDGSPFKLLTKPWLDEELTATVRLAFDQYAVNLRRDELIDEYSSIRANAERAHAFHVLDALLLTAPTAVHAESIAQLPVGVLLLKDDRVILVNSAARRFLANNGLPVPEADAPTSNLPPPLAKLLAAAEAAARGKRTVYRFDNGGRFDFFVLETAAGTMLAFAPAPRTEHPMT